MIIDLDVKQAISLQIYILIVSIKFNLFFNNFIDYKFFEI